MKYPSVIFIFLISLSAFFFKPRIDEIKPIKPAILNTSEPLKITSFHFKEVDYTTKKIISETDAVVIFSFYNDLKIVRIKFPEGSLGYKITNYQGLNKDDSTELNWTLEDKTVLGYQLVSPKSGPPTLYEFRSDNKVVEYTDLQIEVPK